MKKKLATIGLIVLSTLTFTTTSFAAGWRQNKTGWWYQKNDGDCVKMEWRNIDGKWYYFDLSGYMVHDQWVGDYYVGSDGSMLTNTTTPDGYQVDASGKWKKNNDYSESDLLSLITKQAPYIVRNKATADFDNDGKNEMVALMIDTHNQERGCTAYLWYSNGERAYCFSKQEYWWLKKDEFVLIPTDDGVQLAFNILWRQAGDEKEAFIYKLSDEKASLMFTDSGFELITPSQNKITFVTSYCDGIDEEWMPGGAGTFSYANGEWKIGTVNNAGQFGGTSGFYNGK